VREPDGLAMSSRNMLLNPAERSAAVVLYKSLSAARDEWAGGRRDADHLRVTMRGVLEAEPLARVDYVSAADPVTLHDIEGSADKALLSMAVFIGTTRLIDNFVLGDE
jgi:pantoate--beta-alanine ligase